MRSPSPVAGTPIKLSFASLPGNFVLSKTKLRALHPELFSESTDSKLREGWLKLFADQMENGDCRAAVVINADQGLVAAYTDELDCVAMLQFKPEVVRAAGWKTGARLVTVNTYQPAEKGIAADLLPGPGQTGDFGNFRPVIADLLTDQLDRVEQRKLDITDAEWSRAQQMGNALLQAGTIQPRDGRPLRCDKPIKSAQATPPVRTQQPTSSSRRAARQPTPSVTYAFGDYVTVLALMMVSFAAAWAGIGHLGKMEHDFNFYLACFGVLFFAVIGLRFAYRLYAMLTSAR